MRYDAPPTVGCFMESDVFVRLIVGPVGSGKSSGCLTENLVRASKQTPSTSDGIRKTRGAIIRNTYRQLSDTTRKTFEAWIPNELGKWNETDFSFHMRFADVDCELLFRALDKPQDVKKLLSLDLTWAYINEAREVPIDILKGLKARVGRYPPMAEGGPTWSGIWMDTNPMAVGHDLYKLFKEERPEGHELFEQPDALGPNAENTENLPPGYYERLCQGQDKDWIDEYVRSKYPKRDKGSVYGELLGNLQLAGGIGCEFEHEADNIFPVFDLGVSDATSIWWSRPNAAGGVDFLDHYENSGKTLEHFFDELDRRMEERGWSYSRIVLPHDARARTLVTGMTVLDRFLEKYPGKVDVLPSITIEDGISAFRWLLEQPTRFHARCTGGVKALRAYRYQWDQNRLVFSREPLHDWSSHTADSGRYTALYFKRAQLLSHKPQTIVRPSAVPLNNSFSLDQLWDAHSRGNSGRDRI